MRPRSWALALLLAACSVEPSDDTFRAYVSLWDHLVPASNTQQIEEIRAFLRREAKSDDVVVTHFVGAVMFDDLDLPPGSELVSSLRVWREKRYPHDSVDVTAVQTLADGRRVESRVRVELGRGERQNWTPFILPLAGDAPTTGFHLQFAAPDGEPTQGRLKMCLLRPHVRHAAPQRPVPPERRQVFFLTLDTLRRDHLGCYGATDVRTPNLDAFARDAHLFEDAFSTANVTNPSHVSMFTSLYLKDHGVLNNFARLDPECPNMIEELGEAGFRTAGFVGSFNFQPERSDLPERFQDFHGCGEHFERRAEDVNDDLFQWLGEHHDEDLFVWAHYFDAHMPYVPPYPYNGWYDETGDEKIQLPIRKDESLDMYDASDDLAYYKNMYRGEISYLDAQLGRLFELLRDLGLYDSALIVVVADHGEHLGENGIYCEHRGLYDHTTAVPLMIKFPGGLYAGRSPGLVSTVDIYPTVFETLGLEVPGPVRGQSLLGLASGRADATRDRVYSEHTSAYQVSVRTAERRALLGLEDKQIFPEFAIVAGKLELYDVARGQEPEDDLAAERAEEAAFFAEELRAFRAERMAYEAVDIDDPEYVDSMRALGYVDAPDEDEATPEPDGSASTSPEER